jgi:hypothetical protein
MTARTQLAAFINKYRPELAREGRAALRRLRRAAPGAVELVYDNYNWLVVGFGPNERPSDAVFSLVFAPKWLALCFLQDAPSLPDPAKLLRGSGRVVRNVRLMKASDLDQPAVRALIREALARTDVPIRKSTPARTVIRSVSKKQRPRR